tara:strand:- start:533 stop:703 length:171 start_codon:yes stop_codon:yes gene_type:complete
MTYNEAVERGNLQKTFLNLCENFTNSKKLKKFYKKMSNEQLTDAIVMLKYKIKSGS